MNIITTIIPIFAVIFLGWFVRRKGFMPPSFLAPANRLVYHLAIPAMIFHKIAKASLRTQFDGMVIVVTLAAIIAIFTLAWAVGLVKRLERKQLGTFMQCSFHGNLGYIGLAVAYYYLGNEGFVSASIIAGFVMILQNFLAVVALQLYSESNEVQENRRAIVLKVFANPVIVSALTGMLYSLTGIGMPLVIDRSLAILSGLALPMALLIIGASLSFELMQLQVSRVMITGVIKLVLLPGLGYILYCAFGLAMQDYLPGLILLAAPSATLTYIMAKEMKGDTEFAVAAISTTTMASAITFSIWLNIVG